MGAGEAAWIHVSEDLETKGLTFSFRFSGVADVGVTFLLSRPPRAVFRRVVS